jgi:hypothetical protein
MPSILAVRAQEYVQQVSALPFVGLPREELERLHGAVAVLALERLDAGCLPLTAYAAIHYNYAWLTGLDGPGTFGKRVPLYAAGEPPVFLDEALDVLARGQLQAAGLPSAPCDWRCAGVVREQGQLALVYVVRLRQRWVGSELTRGNGELQFGRAGFDALGQRLIENLHAL